MPPTSDSTCAIKTCCLVKLRGNTTHCRVKQHYAGCWYGQNGGKSDAVEYQIRIREPAHRCNVHKTDQVIEEAVLRVIDPFPGHRYNDRTGDGWQIEGCQKECFCIFIALLNQGCQNHSNKDIGGYC